MYDVALSVLACLRANTDVHVAWIVSAEEDDGTQAIALTPGGGQIGTLLDGAINDAIIRNLPDIGDGGGIVTISLGPAEALMSGLPQGTELSIGIVPGTALPETIWTMFADREPVSIAFALDDRRLEGAELLDDGNVPAGIADDRLVVRYVPVPRMMIVGGGPVADALDNGFTLAGWQPMVVANPGNAGGAAATLSSIDGVIVMGHDVEMSGRALQDAISSKAGYIGSIGSIEMQELRREWLAYRGVAWDERIHGPAGLPIGAANPGEMAISIVAEAVAASHLNNL
ncbi:MAG: XdhC family protein [Acidimicrobiia bacterium]